MNINWRRQKSQAALTVPKQIDPNSEVARGNLAQSAGRNLLLLSLVVALGFFGGCTRKASDDLVLLSPGGAQVQALKSLVAEFEREHPGVRVQLVTSPGKDYYVKSLTMLAGRAHVDVLWIGQGFGIFASRGALMDLQPFIHRDPEFDIGIFHKKLLGWYRYDDKLYGLPTGADVLAIVYNRDLFDAGGVEIPRDGWTVDEMVEKAKKLTSHDPSGRVDVVGLGLVDYDYRYHGLRLLDENHRFALNTEDGRQWLQRNVDLIYTERVLQRGTAMESMDRLNGFLNQKVAITEVAPWDLKELRDRAMFRWDLAPLPSLPGRQAMGWGSSSGFCIARNSKHPDLAWKLLKKLSGAELQRAMFDRTMPGISSLYQEYIDYKPGKPSSISVMVKMLEHAEPNTRISAYQEVEAEWVYWRDRALLRQISVEEALKQAESHINRILALGQKEVAP